MLSGPDEITGTAELQIELGNLEAVVGSRELAQTLHGLVRLRALEEQQTPCFPARAPHATAQLMQLRQPEALRVVDDHQVGAGHVETDRLRRRSC